jgi:DNA-binding NarL/FixJ family response regulator
VLILSATDGSVLIGRASTASICLDYDPAVSRAHAELSNVDGVWLVEDLRSKGATYILRDGSPRRVLGRERLSHGDRIRVGKTTLSFVYPPTPCGETDTALEAEDMIKLTKRELEVLRLLCAKVLSGSFGWPQDAELADALVISSHTVRTHVKHLYAKFNLDGLPSNQKRAELVRRATRDGWV